MVNRLKNFGYVLGWVCWIAFCYFAAQLLAYVVISVFNIEIAEHDTAALTILNSLMFGAMLALAVGGIYLSRETLKIGKIQQILGLARRIKWSDLGRALLTSLAYFGVLFGAMLLLAWFLPDLYNQEQELGYPRQDNQTWQLILIFIALVVVAPVVEELLMRGVLFNRLRVKLPFWPAAIIVSLVFAAAHGQINVALDTFILSLFLCYEREKSGAIYSPILIHMLKNTIGFLMVFVFGLTN